MISKRLSSNGTNTSAPVLPLLITQRQFLQILLIYCVFEALVFPRISRRKIDESDYFIIFMYVHIVW